MEALQKMADPVLVDCPKCGQAGLKKQVTAAAFKLKGTGWYETDFKNPQPAAAQSTAPAPTSPTPSTAATPSATNATSAKSGS